MSHKILVCNNVLGRWKQLFTKVSDLLRTKGQFDALFCIGSFFPKEENKELESDIQQYLNGTLQGD